MPDIFYADQYQPSFGFPWPEYSLEEALALDPEKQKKLAEVLPQVKENALADPIEFGFTLKSWRKVLEEWPNYMIFMILGGNRCLAPEQEIYDPVAKTSKRIDQIKEPFHVNAWDGSKVVVAEASAPFRKTVEDLYEVRLSSGRSFRCSAAHRVLSADGTYVSIRDVKPGDGLYLPSSSSDTYPSGHEQGDRRCFETGPGSQVGCHPSPRSYGEQPRWVQGIGQGAFPSQADVQTRTFAFCSNRRSPSSFASHSLPYTWDGLEGIPSRIRCWWKRALLSIQDDLRLISAPFSYILSRVFYRPCISAWGQLLAFHRSTLGFYPGRSTRGSSQPGSLSRSISPSPECIQYVTHVNGLRRDYVWDISVPGYENYICEGVVHHNSTKSTFVSRLMVDMALTIPECKLRCFSVNDESSVNDQQAMIWHAIPDRFKEKKKKKRGQTESIDYTQRNGFVGNKVIFPPQEGYRRGSEIIFQTYRSYANDPQVCEGWFAHGVWNDEEAPQKLVETQIYRVTDTRGKIFNTFTTLQGWSPLVADVLASTKTLEKRYGSLVGKELPVMQKSLSRSRTLITYFWTQDNPWIDQASMIKDLEVRPTEEKLARAYGIPTRAAGSKFPLFDELVHVIEHDKLPWMQKHYPITRYMALDPGGSKNWFMMWVAVDEAGTVWVYDEWPGPDMEPWAIPGSDVKGKPGKGQQGMGYGIRDYIELIRDIEQGKEPFERYIDSRMGNAEKHAREGATSISIDLEDEGMPFMDAPGLDIEHGLQLINNLLAYDTDKPISSTNGPRLYVSDRCRNTIFALKNFTGLGGKTEACKDPIDCLRYLLESRIEHFSPNMLAVTGTGGY